MLTRGSSNVQKLIQKSIKAKQSGAKLSMVSDEVVAADSIKDINDCINRRLVFNLYEAASLTVVGIKLEIDFEAILKL